MQPTEIKHHDLWKDFVFTILSLGIFNLWIQFRQIEDINGLKQERLFSLTWVVLFTVLTIGLYFAYYQVRKTIELEKLALGEAKAWTAVLAAVCAIVGVWFFMDLYHQSLLNRIVQE